MYPKTYTFEIIIQKVTDIDGAYVEISLDVRKEFGKGRVSVRVTFDGEPYDGQVVKIVHHAISSGCGRIYAPK
jgi:hypothetical protein